MRENMSIVKDEFEMNYELDINLLRYMLENEIAEYFIGQENEIDSDKSVIDCANFFTEKIKEFYEEGGLFKRRMRPSTTVKEDGR